MQGRKTHLSVIEIDFDALGIHSRLDVYKIEPNKVLKAIKNRQFYADATINNLNAEDAKKFLLGQKPIKDKRIHVVIEYDKNDQGKLMPRAFGFLGSMYPYPGALARDLMHESMNQPEANDSHAGEKEKEKEMAPVARKRAPAYINPESGSRASKSVSASKPKPVVASRLPRILSFLNKNKQSTPNSESTDPSNKKNRKGN